MHGKLSCDTSVAHSSSSSSSSSSIVLDSESEEMCWPWNRSDAATLAGYATMMMMMMSVVGWLAGSVSVKIPLKFRYKPADVYNLCGRQTSCYLFKHTRCNKAIFCRVQD